MKVTNIVIAAALVLSSAGGALADGSGHSSMQGYRDAAKTCEASYKSLADRWHCFAGHHTTTAVVVHTPAVVVHTSAVVVHTPVVTVSTKTADARKNADQALKCLFHRKGKGCDAMMHMTMAK